ncbi:hypothetical protein MNBD_NITROSPINAE02-860 [hydrothermal vent metagenome]|uniref:Big-1 domain-containing protein n=1 Tax=hydrothermal vent metagenome TaxID=652676 RepID=A0A3B1D8S2_9ZZZZ
MMMKTKLARALFPLVLGAVLLVQSGCGPQDEQSAQNKVGPAGPTTQNKLYFDLAIAPHTIQSGSTVSIIVKVWDSAGNMASDVLVILSGIVIDPTKATTQTDGNGWSGWIVKVKDGPGTIVNITATVEGMSLTAPLQIIAGPTTGQ